MRDTKEIQRIDLDSDKAEVANINSVNKIISSFKETQEMMISAVKDRLSPVLGKYFRTTDLMYYIRGFNFKNGKVLVERIGNNTYKGRRNYTETYGEMELEKLFSKADIRECSVAEFLLFKANASSMTEKYYNISCVDINAFEFFANNDITNYILV